MKQRFVFLILLLLALLNACLIHYFDETTTTTTTTTTTSTVFSPFDSSTMIAVSTNGDDISGTGTIDHPYRSLPHAIFNIGSKAEIRVANGTYTPGYGLNPNGWVYGIELNSLFSGKKISGGWDEQNFSNLSGQSVLYGNITPNYSIVQMNNTSNITFERFVVTGGKAFSGGGINISGGFGNIINECVIAGNDASNDGGGLWIGGGVNILKTQIGTSAYPNRSFSGNGGGVFIANSVSGIIIEASIEFNQAMNGGGIYICGTNNQISTSIKNNIANGNGGGIFVADSGTDNDIKGAIIKNISTNGNGGGIYLTNSTFIINTTKIHNILISRNEARNLSMGYGAGVYINNTNSNQTIIINAVELSDNIGYYAGGLYINSNNGNLDITNSIFGRNTCDNTGVYYQLYINFTTAVIKNLNIVGNVLYGSGILNNSGIGFSSITSFANINYTFSNNNLINNLGFTNYYYNGSVFSSNLNTTTQMQADIASGNMIDNIITP